MKCIAAVVMMALAAVADAGLAPLYYGAPLALAAPHTTVVQSNSEPKLIATAPALAPLAYAHAPLAYAGAPLTYAAPYYYGAPLAYSAPALIYQKEARYLAANRGAIHEAPLPGHAFSQQQLNLEAAPGSD
ncbi:adult cuticle protein 1-like [Anopheles aquasalis]|nr:adult cuticle protein 1-like [Anopheles aquasalis]XP_050095445.1 adult cuticle protein 1-like [Anopheles aquasalis]